MSITQLSQRDLEHAASIVQRVYSPQNQTDQLVAQKELFEVQQKPVAWNLIFPFLQHDDPNLQFIGAHTAQVKISRDWDTLPEQDVDAFRESLLGTIARATSNKRSKVVLRKLYVALVSLALRLTAQTTPRWPDWVVSSTSSLSSLGVPPEHLLDYLAIVAEEAGRSDLTGAGKAQLSYALRGAAKVVAQAVGTSLSGSSRSLDEKTSALRCFEAWTSHLPGEELGIVVPLLINTLSHSDLFVETSDVLCEVLTASSMSGGAGTKNLTVPLLSWIEQEGKDIFESSVETETIDDVSRGLCKMLVAIGDHSLDYIVKNMNEAPVQNFLRIMLGYTGFPGWYGVDEEESDLTTSFWVYFGEAILDSDWNGDAKNPLMVTSRAVLVELVQVLQRKSRWPSAEELRGWTKDQSATFTTYRRDIGESILNAYYVLRDETLKILVQPVLRYMESMDPLNVDWEDIEASLHCISCSQDGVPLSANEHLETLVQTFPKLPTVGHLRVRRTALTLIGNYSTWFAEQETSLLLVSVSYVVSGLHDPALSLLAAGALKQLCDANRTKLAPHIAAFAEIHAASANIPTAERAKVIESIGSVIEALSPPDGVVPTLAIVVPVIDEWASALQIAPQYPEDARTAIVQQLKLLSAAAKGLSPAQDVFSYDEPDTPSGRTRVQIMEASRCDPSLLDSRQRIVSLLQETMSYWSTDPEVSDAISELMRSITTLPLENTLVSLPPAPLLELVCLAAGQQLTAVWLSLASRLVVQLEPPTFTSLKAEPEDETRKLVDQAAQSIVMSSMRYLQMPGVMDENPDLVQAFFSCIEAITHSFLRSIMALPVEVSSALIDCTVQAISLQERYSLVGACKFLVTFIKRSMSNDSTQEAAQTLLYNHGQRITSTLVHGIAGDAPRSAVQNLAAVLSVLVSKLPSQTRGWLQNSMASDQLTANPRITSEAKDAFIRAINGFKEPLVSTRGYCFERLFTYSSGTRLDLLRGRFDNLRVSG